MLPAPRHAAALLGTAAALLLVGCAGAPAAESPVASSEPALEQPAAPAITPLPLGGAVDYQLGGGYAPAEGVTIVVRDSTDAAAEAVYSICYLNGFQTQPQDADEWLAARPDLLLRDAGGDPVIDPNWPDEYLLDTRTEPQREAIAAWLAPQLEACADAGFQAVEFDNLDSFTRSDGLLTEEGNLALASRYVQAAHDAGLAAGQKNSAELAAAGRDDVGFDFAVAEECHLWGECAAYTAVYGDQVIDIEYTDDLRLPFAEICADPDQPPLTVLRDRMLVTPSHRDYAFEVC